MNLGKNLHHAYCIIGDKEKNLAELKKFFEKELKFTIKNNPDFWQGDYDSLNIDEARQIAEAHKNTPISDKKIFVITANFINEKAQNAMLKVFEEPRGDTHFFMLMPTADNLLPTLKSRLFIIDEENGVANKTAKEFLEGSIKRRLEIIAELTESIKNEEKSKIEVTNFINSLESEIYKKPNHDMKILEQIEKMRSYSQDPSPSLKMILEYLALTVPVLKI